MQKSETALPFREKNRKAVVTAMTADVAATEHNSEAEDAPALVVTNPSVEMEVEDEEEEDVCRICRCGKEAEHPLFHPCVCSGSIRFVHQDCLMNWLAASKSPPKCEVCGHKFGFTPVYSPDAPENLSVTEIVSLFCGKIAKMVPFILRAILVGLCWLVLVPLATRVLFRSLSLDPWGMRRTSKGSWMVLQEQLDLTLEEAVDSWSFGVCVNGCIMLSFLALLTVVDFVRFDVLDEEAEAAVDRDAQVLAFVVDEEEGEEEEAVPHIQPQQAIIPALQQQQLIPDEAQDEHGAEQAAPATAAAADDDQTHARHAHAINGHEQRQEDNNGDDHENPFPGIGRTLHDININNENIVQPTDIEREVMIQPVVHPVLPPLPPPPPPPLPHQVAAGGGGAEGAQAIDAEAADGGDGGADVLMDNVALDELMGLRGPLYVLLHNIVWLLTFDGLYLCIGLLLPTSIGAHVIKNLSDLFLAITGYSLLTRGDEDFLFGRVETQSFRQIQQQRQQRALAPLVPPPHRQDGCSDLTSLLNDSCLNPFGGQAATGSDTCMFASTSWIPMDMRTVFKPAGVHASQAAPMCVPKEMFTSMFRDGALEISSFVIGYLVEASVVFALLGMAVTARQWTHRMRVRRGDTQRNGSMEGMLEQGITVLRIVSKVIKATLLLALKMGLVPITLGFLFERCTRHLFTIDMDKRYLFAIQQPLFSVLVLWVAGISHMLVITVIVLQLREVLHPDLLHGIIRPHDPDVNLLRTLLIDPLPRHLTRMVISCAIYTLLIMSFVYVPIRLMKALLPVGTIPFAPRLFYSTVELQLPLELVVFHVSVLHLLDNTKEVIMSAQTMWLNRVCGALGLVEYVLPCKHVPGDGRQNEVLARCDCIACSEKIAALNVGNANGRGGAAVAPPAAQEQQQPGPANENEQEAENGAAAAAAVVVAVPRRRAVFPLPNVDGVPAFLLPRVRPTYCFVRVGLLVLAAWASCAALLVLSLVVPFALGDAIMALLYIPNTWINDLHVLYIGWLLLWQCGNALVHLDVDALVAAMLMGDEDEGGEEEEEEAQVDADNDEQEQQQQQQQQQQQADALFEREQEEERHYLIGCMREVEEDEEEEGIKTETEKEEENETDETESESDTVAAARAEKDEQKWSEYIWTAVKNELGVRLKRSPQVLACALCIFVLAPFTIGTHIDILFLQSSSKCYPQGETGGIAHWFFAHSDLLWSTTASHSSSSSMAPTITDILPLDDSFTPWSFNAADFMIRQQDEVCGLDETYATHGNTDSLFGGWQLPQDMWSCTLEFSPLHNWIRGIIAIGAAVVLDMQIEDRQMLPSLEIMGRAIADLAVNADCTNAWEHLVKPYLHVELETPKFVLFLAFGDLIVWLATEVGLSTRLGLVNEWRLCAFGVFLGRSVPGLVADGQAMLKTMHDVLRDDKYLVGKKLHNLESRLNRSSAGSSVAN